MSESIVDSFRALVAHCSDPSGLADDFLSLVDSDYTLSNEEWHQVIEAVRSITQQEIAKRETIGVNVDCLA
jgi:hypothetical protein